MIEPQYKYNPLRELKCLVMDFGNYFSVAERLARADGFGTVWYYMPKIINGYPDHKPLDVGRGVWNVGVVNEWAKVFPDVDVVVFPDSHEPAFQMFCQNMGKKVYGCRYGCDLEHNRVFLKELMTELGLPVNDYDVVYGIDELDAALKEKTDVYIKSSLRGDMETWHHTNYTLSKGELQRLRNHLGAYQNKERYIIETPIDSIAEVGIDTMTAGGRYLKESLSGIELKDTGYYGEIVSYKDLPKQLRSVTDKLSQSFAMYNYNGAYSNEVIISNNMKGYLVDNTCRAPQPPTDLMLEMYDNFPEVVWGIANGMIPEVKYKNKCGVQLIIKSDIARTEPSPIIVPEEYRNFVKLKNLTIDDDGTWYYTPIGIEMTEIGSCVGMGATRKEAINMATMIAESIHGFDIKINTDCIDKAMEQINKLKSVGINYLM